MRPRTSDAPAGFLSVTCRLAVVVLCTALVSAGCVNIYDCDPTAPGADLSELNQKLSGRVARAELRDGRLVTSSNLSVSADSLFAGPGCSVAEREGAWRLWHHSERVGFPISSVETISMRRAPAEAGAAFGVVTGFALGAIAGSVIGAATYDPDVTDPDWASSSYTAASKGGALFGVIAAPLGALLGARANLEDVYVMPWARPDAARRAVR